MIRRTLLTAAIVIAAAIPAAADMLTYENSRFGTSVTFPLDVFDQIEQAPENGDGRTFSSEDGAELSIFGSNNAEGLTPDGLIDRLTGVGQDSGMPVEYKASGNSWAVVSGYDGDTIYYERHEFGANDIIHTVSMRYPRDLRDEYDPLVKPIVRSLSGP